MQTFLPFPDFKQSLSYLDTARLNKQILETWQLCQGQWPNHPAAKMWVGYEPALKLYGYATVKAAQRRGINVNANHVLYFNKASHSARLPWWFGDTRFHKSHLENLHWKWKPKGEQPPYVWPVHRHEWEDEGLLIRINRRRKPIHVIRKELAASETTTGKTCFFLLEGFNK